MDRFLIFPADHTSHFTISPFANLAKGGSGYHSHNGMRQGIAGSKAYCFAGEVFISENLKKTQAGKILDIQHLFQNKHWVSTRFVLALFHACAYFNIMFLGKIFASD
jgi:hypothetical protein